MGSLKVIAAFRPGPGGSDLPAAPRDATCSLVSKATTIVSGSIPPSTTSPPTGRGDIHITRCPPSPAKLIRGEWAAGADLPITYNWGRSSGRSSIASASADRTFTWKTVFIASSLTPPVRASHLCPPTFLPVGRQLCRLDRRVWLLAPHLLRSRRSQLPLKSPNRPQIRRRQGPVRRSTSRARFPGTMRCYSMPAPWRAGRRSLSPVRLAAPEKRLAPPQTTTRTRPPRGPRRGVRPAVEAGIGWTHLDRIVQRASNRGDASRRVAGAQLARAG